MLQVAQHQDRKRSGRFTGRPADAKDRAGCTRGSILGTVAHLRLSFTTVNPKTLQTFSRSVSLAAPTQRIPSNVHAQHRVDVTDKGTHIVRGLRIFKEGTFKDSMGTSNTWTSLHLDQMILHFRWLSDMGLFSKVPLRSDHSFSTDSVIGWVVGVYRDPIDPTFLAADIEFTELDAYEKWDRGTYGPRSLEVGVYETNDGAEYWPVVMGLAFVDIPAVEGLHSSSDDKLSFFSHVIVDQEEKTVTPEEWARAANYAKALDDWSVAANYAKACGDWVLAVTYAQWVQDAMIAQYMIDQGIPNPGQHAKPTPFKFRINGGEVENPIAVQAHIDQLEAFARETRDATRKDYVTQLGADGKIAGPQVESMTKLALEMTDDQFADFRTSYDAAPKLGLLAPVPTPGDPGGGPTNPFPQTGSAFGFPAPGATPPGMPQPLSEEDTLRGILEQHRKAGKSSEYIRATPSFKKLEALCAAAGKPVNV